MMNNAVVQRVCKFVGDVYAMSFAHDPDRYISDFVTNVGQKN